MLEEDRWGRDTGLGLLLMGAAGGSVSCCRWALESFQRTPEVPEEGSGWSAVLCVSTVVGGTGHIVDYEFFPSSLLVSPPPSLNKSDRISLVK